MFPTRVGTSLGLSATGGGLLGFSLLGKGENGHVYLGGGGPATPVSFRLLDRQHKFRAVLELSDDGAPSLEMSDMNGNSRAVLGRGALTTARTGATEQRPESSLVLFDKDGKVIWTAP